MLDCTVLLHVGLLLHRKKLQTKINTVNTTQGIFCALPMTPFWLHLLCRMVCLFFHECIPQASPKLAAIKFFTSHHVTGPNGCFFSGGGHEHTGHFLQRVCAGVQLCLNSACHSISVVPRNPSFLGLPGMATKAHIGIRELKLPIISD